MVVVIDIQHFVWTVHCSTCGECFEHRSKQKCMIHGSTCLHVGVRISVSHSAGTFYSINAFNFSVTVIQSKQSKGIWFRHMYT